MVFLGVGILGNSLLALFFYCGVWFFNDARKRGWGWLPALLLAISGWTFLIFAYFFYLMYRPPMVIEGIVLPPREKAQAIAFAIISITWWMILCIIWVSG